MAHPVHLGKRIGGSNEERERRGDIKIKRERGRVGGREAERKYEENDLAIWALVWCERFSNDMYVF